MERDKIRVGIVGASETGWASRAHIPALTLLPGFELMAVSTTKLSSAQAAAQKFGATYAFDNEQDLINCPDVDLVVIAVKVPDHYKLVRAAIEAGKMIYCEWPLGNGTQEAAELAELATAKGVRNFTGLQSLSLPETLYLKKVITEGLIGDVLSSTIIGSGGGWVDVRAESALYMLDPAHGSTLLEIPFGHTLAAYTAVLGDYKTISAVLARRRSEVTLLTTGEKVPQLSNDQIVVSGLLEDGAVSAMHYRSGLSAGSNLLWEINGTRGDIVLTGGLGHYQLTQVALQFAPTGEPLKPLDMPVEFLEKGLNALSQPVYGLYYAYRSVWNDIKNNSQFTPDFNKGVHLHQLLDSIKKSAAEQKTVRL